MKRLLLTVAVVTVAISTNAQELYVGVNAGYGFPAPNQVIGTNTTSNGSGTTTENIYGSFGGGLNLGLTPGFWLGDHVGAELGLNYFMGNDVEASKTTTPFGTATGTVHSSQFRLQPALIIRSSNEPFNIYTKVGLVIPVAGKTIQEIENTGAAGPGTAYNSTSETVGNVTLGYTGAIGFNLALGDRLTYFTELSATSLRISANNTTVTDYSSESASLSDLPTYSREINYVDELNSSSNTGPGANQNQAEDRLRINNNYSAIFLNIGIKFSF